MIKVYSVARFLSDENKETINAVCDEYGYEIEYFDTPEEADGKVSDGEIIYCPNPAVLHQMKDLRWCHSASAGVDRFVETGIFDSGDVILTNSSGAYGRAISEHIIMVTLMLLRRMPDYLKITGARQWKANLAVRSIADSRIAIIGTGDVGCSAAKRFKALGAGSVIGFNRTGRKPSSFDDVYTMDEFCERASDADAVIICVPATPETAGLLDEDKIRALSEKAFVVNVGRGTSVDQDALVAALNEGRIAGAALDVMVPEPLPPDHPLWTARNCIITPHSSGDMGLEYTVDITVSYFCENLKRYASGEELIKRVDPAAGY